MLHKGASEHLTVAFRLALENAGILLRRYTFGTHRAACPRCDKGPGDDALAITIHSTDDIVWVCHRCRWADGWRANSRHGSDSITRSLDSPRETHPSHLSIVKHIENRHLQPITPDNLAGQYLLSRSCALPVNDVLFTLTEWHPHERRYFPCMVSVVTNIVTAEPMTLHFTFLDPGGDGKAKINRPRLYLKGYPKTGGTVRLQADDEVIMGV